MQTKNDRLLLLRKKLKLSANKFGSRLGISSGAVYEVEKGRNNLTEQMLLAVCKIYNVSEDWLRDGKGEMFVQAKADYLEDLVAQFNLDTRDVDLVRAYLDLPPHARGIIKDFIVESSASMTGDDLSDSFDECSVPYEYQECEVLGKAAAGQGYHYLDDTPPRYKTITSEQVPPHDFALEVTGDSMAPTIRDGDTIFLKLTTDKLDGRIYALDIDGTVVVKRTYFLGKKLKLVSDNPDWEDRYIEGGELKNAKIIGMIVGWTNQK